MRDLNGVPVVVACLFLVNERHIKKMNADGEVILPIDPEGDDADDSIKHLRVHCNCPAK